MMKLSLFDQLQTMFMKPTFLCHFNLKRQLYIDVDASKKFGFNIIVYHIRGDLSLAKYIKKRNIEPILFLSKLQTPVEKNY